MIKFLEKKDSIIKIVLLIYFFLTPFASMAEINADSWIKNCTAKDCFIAIRNELKSNNTEKVQVLATAYVRVNAATLLTKNENIFFVNLPFNVNLRANPLLTIDGTVIGNLSYSHSNTEIGCSSNVYIPDDIINLFKKGKELSVTIGVIGKKNKIIKFPLKNFSNSYKLLKK